MMILSHDGTNGLKGITDKYDDLMIRVETGRESTVLDMDTPAAYEELKEFYERGMKSEALSDLAKGRTFYLVRHGQPRSIRTKYFWDRQTCLSVKPAGSRQKRQKQSCPVIYTRIYSSRPQKSKGNSADYMQ